MSIGMRRWQVVIPATGAAEMWLHLAEKTNGTFYRLNQLAPEPAWVIPDYQRGRMWTHEQSSLFIGHVLLGGLQPAIYMHRGQGDTPIEIIDGQQRLLAISAWIQGTISASVWHDGGRHEYLYADLSQTEQMAMTLTSTIVYVDLPRRARLRLYLGLNGGGTPHTEAELVRVRDLLAASEPCSHRRRKTIRSRLDRA